MINIVSLIFYAATIANAFVWILGAATAFKGDVAQGLGMVAVTTVLSFLIPILKQKVMMKIFL